MTPSQLSSRCMATEYFTPEEEANCGFSKRPRDADVIVIDDDNDDGAVTDGDTDRDLRGCFDADRRRSGGVITAEDFVDDSVFFSCGSSDQHEWHSFSADDGGAAIDDDDEVEIIGQSLPSQSTQRTGSSGNAGRVTSFSSSRPLHVGSRGGAASPARVSSPTAPAGSAQQRNQLLFSSPPLLRISGGTIAPSREGGNQPALLTVLREQHSSSSSYQSPGGDGRAIAVPSSILLDLCSDEVTAVCAGSTTIAVFSADSVRFYSTA
jgi:hypothetical protein